MKPGSRGIQVGLLCHPAPALRAVPRWPTLTSPALPASTCCAGLLLLPLVAHGSKLRGHVILLHTLQCAAATLMDLRLYLSHSLLQISVDCLLSRASLILRQPPALPTSTSPPSFGFSPGGQSPTNSPFLETAAWGGSTGSNGTATDTALAPGRAIAELELGGVRLDLQVGGSLQVLAALNTGACCQWRGQRLQCVSLCFWYASGACFPPLLIAAHLPSPLHPCCCSCCRRRSLLGRWWRMWQRTTC